MKKISSPDGAESLCCAVGVLSLGELEIPIAIGSAREKHSLKSTAGVKEIYCVIVALHI